MAMKILHDASAALAVNELNKNANNLQKDLKKVASGMRINSAADDASGYAIGERMAIRLRALNQDIINAQTGSDLIRVAEGGVQSVIEELRTLKELALNSINDHNSELDRATLQKEFEQRTAGRRAGRCSGGGRGRPRCIPVNTMRARSRQIAG